MVLHFMQSFLVIIEWILGRSYVICVFNKLNRYFTSEKKAAIPVEDCVVKITQSFGTSTASCKTPRFICYQMQINYHQQNKHCFQKWLLTIILWPCFKYSNICYFQGCWCTIKILGLMFHVKGSVFTILIFCSGVCKFHYLSFLTMFIPKMHYSFYDHSLIYMFIVGLQVILKNKSNFCMNWYQTGYQLFL